MPNNRPKRFNSIDDIFNSEILKLENIDLFKTDRILKSTRLENEIFHDLFNEDDTFKDIATDGLSQLSTFDSLIQDVFTAFYSISIKKNDESNISDKSKHFNLNIIDELLTNEEFLAIKSICECKDIPSFEACQEFSQKILDQLPETLKKTASNINALDTLEKQINELQEKLREYFSERTLEKAASYDMVSSDTVSSDTSSSDENPVSAKPLNQNTANEKNISMCSDGQALMPREQHMLRTAESLERKLRQMQNLDRIVSDNMIASKAAIKKLVSEASETACNKALETLNILSAWGDSLGTNGHSTLDTDILKKVYADPKLLEISKTLGRYREIISAKRKNGFSFGLVEKYDISFGNNINLCLSSEIALLASSETQPLFIRKYQQKSLKQYRKRQLTSKGQGDIIVCLDESSSMEDIINWAYAFTFAMLDIAHKDKRKFALVHFSSIDELQTDLFIPGQYTFDDIIKTIHHFFCGGTNFETPLTEALGLIHNYSERTGLNNKADSDSFDKTDRLGATKAGFDKADILFITDGECAISESFSQRFLKEKQGYGFTVTGILIDQTNSNAGKSLVKFCDKVYRMSNLTRDEIFLKML